MQPKIWKHYKYKYILFKIVLESLGLELKKSKSLMSPNIAAKPNTAFWSKVPLVVLSQGHLKKWTGHSTLILPNPESLEISLTKFQYFYNYKEYDFSPNLKVVAWKLYPPCPWEVLYLFGGKSKFWTPMTLIFCANRGFIEADNWWKFGVYTFNHFW